MPRADSEHLDRREVDSASARGGDAQPAAAETPCDRSEGTVEVAPAPADGSDDGVKGNGLHAEVHLRFAAERGDDVFEGEHVEDVIALESQSGRDPVEGLSPALTIEVAVRRRLLEGHGQAPRTPVRP